jgi:Triose-phosphate Transporter family
MNFNLAKNSVGFYQISKLACIPITLLLETFLNRRQQILSYKMIASLLFIMFGMGLVAVNEISFNVEGFIWAAAGVLCSSCAQIFFSPLQKELNLDALQMLFHLSPILTIGSFATIPLFENVTELIRFDINSKVVIDIGMSCCMAVLLNTSNYLGMCIHWTHMTNPRDDLLTAVNTNLNPSVSFPYLQS